MYSLCKHIQLRAPNTAICKKCKLYTVSESAFAFHMSARLWGTVLPRVRALRRKAGAVLLGVQLLHNARIRQWVRHHRDRQPPEPRKQSPSQPPRPCSLAAVPEAVFSPDSACIATACSWCTMAFVFNGGVVGVHTGEATSSKKRSINAVVTTNPLLSLYSMVTTFLSHQCVRQPIFSHIRCIFRITPDPSGLKKSNLGGTGTLSLRDEPATTMNHGQGTETTQTSIGPKRLHRKQHENALLPASLLCTWFVTFPALRRGHGSRCGKQIASSAGVGRRAEVQGCGRAVLVCGCHFGFSVLGPFLQFREYWMPCISSSVSDTFAAWVGALAVLAPRRSIIAEWLQCTPT